MTAITAPEAFANVLMEQSILFRDDRPAESLRHGIENWKGLGHSVLFFLLC